MPTYLLKWDATRWDWRNLRDQAEAVLAEAEARDFLRADQIAHGEVGTVKGRYHHQVWIDEYQEKYWRHMESTT